MRYQTRKHRLVSALKVKTGTERVVVSYNIPNFEKYAGEYISFGVWVKNTACDTVKLVISDGIRGRESLYNTGSNDWEWLSRTYHLNMKNKLFKVFINIEEDENPTQIMNPVLVVGHYVFFTT